MSGGRKDPYDRNRDYNFNRLFGDPALFAQISNIFYFRSAIETSQLPAERFDQGQRNYLYWMRMAADYLLNVPPPPPPPPRPPPPPPPLNSDAFPALEKRGKISKKEKRGEFDR